MPSRQLSLHERAGLEKADADDEILFSHPSARIIAFSPPTDSIPKESKQTLPDADYPIDAVETLPWRSRTETLASTGAIRIEKVRGSSHFLKSADQKVIHTIMRNSQCWLVDGESKFVLRRGKFRYYRIELPSETDEDKQKVEELKTALGKVLRFERTPCPFKRAFHVDLPDDAITPRRKGTWKRREPLQPTTPNSDPLPLRRSKDSRTWSFQAQNEPSPLRTYGRRGSDYGYSASRGSSRSRPDADGYHSSTPPSVLSSEDAYERQEEERSEGQQPDTESINESEPGESAPSPAPQVLDEKPVPHQGEGDPSSQLDREPTVERAPISAQSQEEELPESIPDPADVPREIPVEQDNARSKETPPVVDNSENSEDENVDDEETPEKLAESLAEESVSLPEADAHEDLQSSQLSEPISSDGATETTVNSNTEEAPVTIEHIQPESEPEPTAGIETASSERDGDDDDALSVDSFYTTDSITQDMLDEQVQAIDFEKLQPAEGFTPFFLNRAAHQRGLSEMTVTASTVESEQSPQKQRPSTSDSTPGLAQSSMSDSSWPSVHTPPSSPSPIEQTLRRRLQAKRSLSPLPPPATLFSPTPSPANHGSPFTADFLQKAANVALVKPIEAVVLLVHILARIAGGATLNDLFSGDLFRRPSERGQPSHQRRTSFPDQAAQPRDDSEEEDDFGVPIRGRTRSAESRQPDSMVETAAIRGREDDQDSIFDLD